MADMKKVYNDLKFKVKVQIFWEGHKIFEIFTLLSTTVHTVKSKVNISQNLVAFSEYVNFIFSIYHFEKNRDKWTWPQEIQSK